MGVACVHVCVCVCVCMYIVCVCVHVCAGSKTFDSANGSERNCDSMCPTNTEVP